MKKDIENYYFDQATNKSTFGGRTVTSFWTPWGIKSMDSEYIHRIKNINKTVTHIVDVKRTSHNNKKGLCEDYWDDYHEQPLDKNFESYDRSCWVFDSELVYREIQLTEREIEWYKKNGYLYQTKEIIGRIYTYTHPIYVAILGGEDPKALRDEIIDNPHLHIKIKENLLNNLTHYETLR